MFAPGQRYKRVNGFRTYTLIEQATVFTAMRNQVVGWKVITDQGRETFISTSNLKLSYRQRVLPDVVAASSRSKSTKEPTVAISAPAINGNILDSKANLERAKTAINAAMSVVNSIQAATLTDPMPKQFIGKVEKYRYSMIAESVSVSFNLNCGDGMVLRIRCSSATLEAALTRGKIFSGEMKGSNINGLLMECRRESAVVPYRLVAPFSYVLPEGVDAPCDRYGRPLFFDAPVISTAEDLKGRNGRVQSIIGGDSDGDYGSYTRFAVGFDGEGEVLEQTGRNLIRIDSI